MRRVLNTPNQAKGAVTQAEAQAMRRAAFNLFKLWGVTDSQARVLLGNPSQSTFYRWKRGQIGTIPQDAIWRLGDRMGIQKAVRHLFTDPQRGYAWVSRPNTAFG